MREREVGLLSNFIKNYFLQNLKPIESVNELINMKLDQEH